MSFDQTAPDISIRVKGVSKTFNVFNRSTDRLINALTLGQLKKGEAFEALKDISFDIRKGESIGIVGTNGSGKSTLLQMVCGTMRPTEGVIETNGRISALLELGAGFNPEFTGRENIFLNASLLGLTRKETEDRLESILTFADIGEFVDRPVRTYSSGMFVRLAFAVAANVSPDILIVDEALAVGDVYFQQKCYKHMRDTLAACTKLFVTHDMRALATLTDRVIVIDRGKLLYDGPPAEGVKFYHQLTQGRSPESQTQCDISASPASGDNHDGPLQIVPEEAKSGRRDIDIKRVGALVNGLPTTLVKPGDEVTFIAEISSSRGDVVSAVLGFNVSDRYGQQLFGQYTLSLDSEGVEITQGLHEARISFIWPRMYRDDFMVTMGVGELAGFGDAQEIQCWANHVLTMQCTTEEPRHGLFSVPIIRFEQT